MIIKELQELGLSLTESKVYLSLLNLGSALAGEITKKSEVNRTNVYDALERLIEKGLVTYVITANRKVFQVVNPKRLKELLKEKQEKLNRIFPDLEERYKETKSKEDAVIFRGKRGIKTIFEDMIKERKDILTYGAESKFAEMFPNYQKQWNLKRKKAKIKIRMLYNEKVRKEKIKEKINLVSMKFLPEKYDFPSTVHVYGNKVVIIVWTELPFGFMIKSKEAVRSNKHFFELLWKQAKN